jgi:tetratricopeptide (TPR) repeat protein
MPSPLRAKASASAVALQAAAFARPAAADQAPGGVVGQAGSEQALGRLNAALDELKLLAVRPHLNQAIAALRIDDYQAGSEAALKALHQDERCGHAWWLLGIARDKAGDLKGALQCYEAAVQLLPDQEDLANDLGRLAYRLGLKPLAEQLFARYAAARPGDVDAANNLACAVRDQFRHAEAIEILRGAIHANPKSAMLWNTLGTVQTELGEFETASLFFSEALNCDEGYFRARYNRGNAKIALGEPEAAIVDHDTAISQVRLPEERAMMQLARSTLLLNLGRITEGWEAYEARLDPAYADLTHFMVDRPRWKPEDDLDGRSLLVMGEQGLGDEVLFANMLPEIIHALGPQGKLWLAVEQRLVPLLQRSFPDAAVGAHASYKVNMRTCRAAPFVGDQKKIDLWTPFGSLLQRFRPSVDSFPDRRAFLVPDPERVRHWQGVLAALGPGPKVGLVWKSLRIDTARARYYSPFEAWAPVLNTPGVRLVNMQYGDCTAEIEAARSQLRVEIFEPPGIDLTQDLDEVAALSSALDLVIGPANATSNIAAACGVESWLISTPGAWPKLGTSRYPWYPSMRVFDPPGYNRWEPVMAEVAEALAARAAEGGTEGHSRG